MGILWRFGLCLAAMNGVWGQSTATLTGKVEDPTEAAIPGVRITVTETSTGTRSETVTTDSGHYTVPALRPGAYTVTAEFEGFRKVVSKPIEVQTGSAREFNIVMTPDEAKQVIEVTGDVPAIETQSSMVSTVIGGKDLESLPMAGRNVLEAALLIPGVTGDAGSDEGGIFQDVPTAGAGLSVGGGRAGSSAILSDGASATSLGIGRATVTFSQDTVQEVQVITSSFSAKYGVSGGGIIQTVGKSGTDRLQGTLYYYHRNPAFAARQFNRPIEPQGRRNEFGFTAGGPVKIPKLYNGKGRTWYFVAVEPKYYFDAIDLYDRVPTLEERNGDFRNTWVPPGQRRPLLYQQVRCVPSPQDCQQFVPQHRPSSTALYPLFSLNDPDPTKRGYVIPKNMFDPLAVKILEEIPLPNQPFDPQGRNYFGTRGVDGRSNRIQAKLDHNITSKNRFGLTFRDIPTFSDRYRVDKTNLAFSFPSDRSVSRQWLFNDTWTVSPSAVNEFRASYTYSDFGRALPGDLATRNYVREKFNLPNQTDWGYPQFSTGWVVYGPSMGGVSNIGDYKEHQYQFSDDVTITRGRHTYMMGMDLRFGQLNIKSTGLRDYCCGVYSFNLAQTYAGNANVPTGNGGLAFAGFLLGLPNSVALRGAVAPYYYRYKVAAAYFQDDFKVRRNLTLNLGVRWQYNSPRLEKFNRQATLDIENPVEVTNENGELIRRTFYYLYSGFDGRSRYLEPAFKRNIDPRLGFAWQPQWGFAKRRYAVLRGGYGISRPGSTGRGRDPIPDFGVAAAGAWGYLRWQSNTALPARTQAVDPTKVISIGRNPPVVTVSPTSLEIPPDGRLCQSCPGTRDARLPAGNSIIFEQHAQSPYTQTWNLTTQFEAWKDSVVSVSYLGQKGVHLYSPLVGANYPDRILYEEMLDQGLDPLEVIEDPLGRVDPRGEPLQVRRVDVIRPIPDAGDVSIAGRTDAKSIYHAATFSIDRRFRRGFLRFNYTWGKSIDTASDGSINAPILGLWGNSRLQNPTDLKANRSVSTFDTRHRFVLSAGNIELPFGARQPLLAGAPKPVRAIVSDWSVSPTLTLTSGFPFQPFLGDANGVPGGASDAERIRPDMVPGVPVINPRWSKNVANDVPYFNPEAFARPGFGELGNAPRTLDYARIPWRFVTNLSVMRDFYPFENRRRRIQIQGQAFNLTNTVTFSTDPGNAYNLFTGTPPVTRNGLSLAGPMPYLLNRGAAEFPVGTREAVLAQYYNQNFGKLWRDRNGPGRIVQLALRIYF